MVHKKIGMTLALLAFLSARMYGVVYRAQYFVKDGKVRILLYDYHKDFIGAQKTKAEVTALKTYGRAHNRVGQPCLFIVEDRDEYTGSDPETIQLLHAGRQQKIQQYQAAPGPAVISMTGLWGFTKQARPVDNAENDQLQAQNIDFRYEMMKFWDGLFVDGDWRNGALKPGVTRERLLNYMRAMEQESQAAINLLQTYHDGPLYTAFYVQATARAAVALDWIRATRTRIEDGAYLNVKFFREIAEHVFSGTGGLVNAFIAHALSVHAGDTCVVVYAGGSHCKAVAPLLESDGYRLVHEAGRNVPSLQGYASLDAFYTDVINSSVNLTQFFNDAHNALQAPAVTTLAQAAAVAPSVTAARQLPGARRIAGRKVVARKAATRKATGARKRSAAKKQTGRSKVTHKKTVQRAAKPAKGKQVRRQVKKKRRS